MNLSLWDDRLHVVLITLAIVGAMTCFYHGSRLLFAGAKRVHAMLKRKS